MNCGRIRQRRLGRSDEVSGLAMPSVQLSEFGRVYAGAYFHAELVKSAKSLDCPEVLDLAHGTKPARELGTADALWVFTMTEVVTVNKEHSIMSTQKLIRSSLALAFAFAVTGTAVAEPSRGGYRDSIWSAACAPQSAGGTSYRNAQARSNLGTPGSVSIRVAGYRGHGPAGQHAAQVASAAGAYCSY